MTIVFSSIRAVILDMDGVLWRGNEVLPGVAEFFAFLQQARVPFALATNNSSKTVATYMDRLTSIGISARPEQIVTSAVATADYMSRHYSADTPVYVIGMDGLHHALAVRGFREDPEQAKIVVVGIDFDLTYDKLRTATLRIRAGADFIGTNGDRTFPTPEGFVPGNGAILAALEAATDTTPLVIGKPAEAMFEVALARLGTAPEHTLMVGDRLETDILGGQRAGLQTALVLTGIATPRQANASGVRIDGIFAGLADLHHAWAASLAPSQ